MGALVTEHSIGCHPFCIMHMTAAFLAQICSGLQIGSHRQSHASVASADAGEASVALMSEGFTCSCSCTSEVSWASCSQKDHP